MYLAKNRGEKATIYANSSNQPYKQLVTVLLLGAVIEPDLSL